MSSRKILKNTVFLYSKSAITVFVTMYSTRLLLKSMGIVDYGIFAVLSGFIAMLSFLNVSMSSASQRYISVFLGEGNFVKLNKLFHTTVLFHFFLSLLLFVILQVIGYFFLEGFLNIPNERIDSAKITYQFIVLATFFQVTAVPYDALISAHEDMAFLSILGVLETFLNLGIALVISITTYDKLIVYGIFYAVLILIIRVIKSLYCFINYKESKLTFKNFKSFFMYKELFSFAKWNLFGALTSVSKYQGLNLILNKFIGPVANSSLSVSNNLNNQLIFFSRTVEQVLKPQLFKNIGSDDKKKSIYIAFLLSKLSFCFTAFISIPFIFYVDDILGIWLEEIPKYSSVISIYLILGVLSNQLTIGLDVLIHANGNIKKYMIFGGMFKLALLPLSCFILYFNGDISIVFKAYFIIEFLNGFIRIYILNNQNITTYQFFLDYIYRIIYPIIGSVITLFIFDNLLSFKYSFFVVFLISSVVFFVIFILMSLQSEEKDFVYLRIKNYLR